jgi:hypothetical protein
VGGGTSQGVVVVGAAEAEELARVAVEMVEAVEEEAAEEAELESDVMAAAKGGRRFGTLGIFGWCLGGTVGRTGPFINDCQIGFKSLATCQFAGAWKYRRVS